MIQSTTAWGSIASILACRRHVQLAVNLGSAGCPGLPVEGVGLDVIQASKPEHRILRYELTQFEWVAMGSFLPTSWYCHSGRLLIFRTQIRTSASTPGSTALTCSTVIPALIRGSYSTFMMY
jgi:hypothetical protein